MTRRAFLFAILAILAINVIAQKQYSPYGEWGDKEAQKMLNDSPWAHTQVETNTSEMFFNPTADPARGTTSTSGDRAVRGATNQATSVNYHIVFLSAKPIREAISRKVELAQKTPNPELSAQLRGFVERDFADYIVVAVTFDSKDPRFANAPNQAFAGALFATLKNNTYLDRNDGKRLFLSQYVPPANDGLGAKFVFARNFEGKPFLASEFTQVRFYSEVSKSVKLDQRFKVSDMQYNGKLEY
jgi:hypothetical protein